MERELTEEELLNVYAGPNRMAMEEKALEHPELYRESQIESLGGNTEGYFVTQLKKQMSEHPEMYRNYPPEAIIELFIEAEEKDAEEAKKTNTLGM